jgi:hypothetical protein
MIIGGDIVQRAIAQLAGVGGHNPFTPVAFSFGWVAYAFSAVNTAFGDRRLMPNPDCDCILLNIKSKQERDNKSWVLGRLVRDFEPRNAKDGGLSLSFFSVDSRKTFGVADWDWVFYLSTFVIVLQVGIACIPGVLHGNWVVFILTASGTFFVQITCSLSQWRAEKWKARPSSNDNKSVVCLTRGNGSNTVLVITSDPQVGLRFEDLASGREAPQPYTIPVMFVMAALWIAHLITTQSLSDNAWFSLAIGALGMTQNLIAAGARRKPGALGVHLREEGPPVHDMKVFKALKAAEARVPGVGFALVSVFFPAGLRKEEEEELKQVGEEQIAKELKQRGELKAEKELKSG